MSAGLSKTDLDARLFLGFTPPELLSLLLVLLLFGFAGLLQYAGGEASAAKAASSPSATPGPAPTDPSPSRTSANPDREAAEQPRNVAVEAALREAHRRLHFVIEADAEA